MKNSYQRKIGAAIVAIASIAYGIYRLTTLINNYSDINVLTATCEFTLLALVCVEASLMATKVSTNNRVQDENVLIESAKKVLYSKAANAEQNAGTNTIKVETEQIVASGEYGIAPIDVVIFAEEATIDQLRRCFLSIEMLDNAANVYVIDNSLSPEREILTKDFSFHVAESFHNIAATTDQVLICRGTDIMYPDAFAVAKNYKVDESTFLELRSVYSDERALGVNGIIEVSDKRQMIREALASRSLSTWSTGPVLVNASALNNSSYATSSASFLRSCERNNIHGTITEEVVSEEISYEQTISEVQWRGLDFLYSSGAWRNSYPKGKRIIGLGVKTWSLMINASLIRRVGMIALVLGFVLYPSNFSFVNQTYISAALATILTVFLGSVLAGDKRGPLARVREYYFDVEAVMYNIYKVFMSPEKRSSTKSIVKKLPSVSFLLIVTDVVLIYRAYIQHKNVPELLVPRLLKYGSLFAGYALLVTLLIGLGMVIIRQSRSAMRREVSRGANIDSKPISMIDLSAGGAGCVSVEPYEEGREIIFESSLPTKNSTNEKFSCNAYIKSCVAWNDSYRLGIEFIDLKQSQIDTLEKYCSIIYPFEQAREAKTGVKTEQVSRKFNGKPEKRFLSYAASFTALAAIIFSNLSNLR
ncbi:MAG: PilZ domain-containing protein [Acidimicrobiia bacterium]